jgi:hypothetical protein
MAEPWRGPQRHESVRHGTLRPRSSNGPPVAAGSATIRWSWCRVYYPAPYMTNDNLEYFEDAYEIGWKKIVDTYAEATQHVDQGLS